MIQAVIFDWAGTTIDYGSRAPIIAFQAAFAAFNIPLEEAVIRQDVGLDKKIHIEKMFADPAIWAAWTAQGHTTDRDAAIDKVYAQFQTSITAILAQTATLKPGMAALAAYLTAKNITMATTSGYTRQMIAQLSPLAAEQGYAPVLNVTSELTHGVGRPDAAMLLKAMQRLYLDNPQEVIKVGDTVNDILEGKNAGVISVGVLEGSNLIGLSEAEWLALSPTEQHALKQNARDTFEAAGADAVIDTLADLMPLIEIYNQQQAVLLLTPGPLTTSISVKTRMLVDHGTWDDDYKALTQDIRQQLLAVGHADAERYSTILMQGSGSFCVESVIQTAISTHNGTLLIAINGAYGQRMAEMAERLGIDYLTIDFGETEPVNADVILEALTQHPEITHFAMVHCETTTGLLNDLSVIPMLNALGVVTIVDAISSFGGVPINIDELHVDYLISSANKCIQGVPGFAFVIANKETLSQTAGNATSLSLDLYEQWRSFEEYAGKWRFTSPTHTVYAFHQALHELQQEGGVTARFERYQDNQARLSLGMRALGFEPLLPETLQSTIITSFKYPTLDFDFMAFYRALKDQGFIIYPGKIAAIDSFRIGNIGEIYAGDISRLLTAVASIMEEALVPTK